MISQRTTFSRRKSNNDRRNNDCYK